MAETPKKMNIRVIGIYLIILLALVRFLIYPLHASLREKKVLLGEWQESYRLKFETFKKQRAYQAEKPIVEKSALFPHLYDKGTPNAYVQSDVLERVTRLAEGKGLTVLNFEMLESVLGKTISEVPVLVRLKGQPGPVLEIIETIEKGEKALSIRSTEIMKSGQDQVFSLTISAFRVEK